MARTPLLRALVQLAADHAAAEQQGTTPEGVREARAVARSLAGVRADVSRRDFLKGATAMGVGALATGLVGAAPARGAAAPRIAIIGAGIAGLNAALTLVDKGLPCTVYESSDRIGGRMHSLSKVIDGVSFWAYDQTSEWCGELIDTGHKTVLALAQRYKLATADLVGAEPNGSEDTYYFFGQYYPKAQADIDFKPVHQALQADVQAASYPTLWNLNTPAGVALDRMNVYDWIESRVPGGHGSPFGQLLDVAYNIEYGAETSDQSSLNLVYLLGYKASPGNFAIFGASDERYHIVGGNQLLPATIAADVAGRGATISLNMQMTALARNADGTYAISFAGQTKPVTADHVILALPFAVLRTLDYRKAGFDARKDTAIQQLGRGRNDKLQLQFDSRYWNTTGAWPGISNGAAYSDTGFQNTWDVTRAQPGPSGILVDYTGGNVAGSFRPSVPYSTTATNSQVTTYANRFLKQLEPVYPGISAAWNGKASHSDPASDPNLLCSYSYWRVGQYVAFSGYEKTRMGNVHFAGEHCSQDFQGFMEGGASEGARAAQEILADLKKA
jgi:monoamine oxidase